ncbi:hypothetical protein BXZ70DRAFT_1008418 [Cristinia sonorae]|uniref:Uncharacterized protein n=1 Tax=Cristinia sonorae TaxID=1940300 RepID=A0A8K0UPE7_9AGAR|nr:hypothetical protein BXZ70DRAFT_1008418 [Cristinia sonorae]
MPPTPPSPQQRANFNYMALTAVVLVSWELAVHFFQDLDYLRTKKLWKRPVMWAYFFQRYGAFVVVSCEAVIRLSTGADCHAAGLAALITGGVFVLPSVSLIFFYRVRAIWHQNKYVEYVLGALWIVVFGASLSAPASQAAGNLPNGQCTITRSEKYTPASFIANAIYDGVILVLTLVKLVANRRQYKNFRSPVQTLLIRDGILYFVISVTIGIVDIAFLLGISNPPLASTVIPLHVAITSIMTTRLVNNVFTVVHDGSGSGPQILYASTRLGTTSASGSKGQPNNSAGTTTIGGTNRSQTAIARSANRGDTVSEFNSIGSPGVYNINGSKTIVNRSDTLELETTDQKWKDASSPLSVVLPMSPHIVRDQASDMDSSK